MSDDCELVLSIIRRIGAEGKVKPMAGEIAAATPWPGRHGSMKRLNDALQTLRAAGKVQYVKKIGWLEVHGDKLTPEQRVLELEAGLGVLRTLIRRGTTDSAMIELIDTLVPE
jgi:hypothetical protein